jgi:HSP20 family protein
MYNQKKEDKTMTLMRMQDSMPSMLQRFFNNDLMDWNMGNFSPVNTSLPAVNVKETEDDYLIEVAAPGMKKDDFKINLDNDRLTISSEKEDEDADNEDDYTRREFCYQSFQRSFNLPERLVDTEKIKAEYKNGVLNVTLPKREEAKPKPAREIKIS